MRCPGCGHESFDLLETCRRCGAPLAASAAATGVPPIDAADELLGLRFEPERPALGLWVPGRRRGRAIRCGRGDGGGDFVEFLDDDAIEVGEADLEGALAVGSGLPADDGGPPFRIDDDLFLGCGPGAFEAPGTATGLADWAGGGHWAAAGAELPGPACSLAGEDSGAGAAGEPIIDRYDEVPVRCWAPEVAGLGRRALAHLVDQALLSAALGLFVLGALLALRHSGIDAGLFLSAAGLQASALPFALLAAVLSLAYHVFFHGTTGCTPGKALAGIEVQTGSGGELTWGRAILRWLGAALGLSCAGIGVIWALFEPRRCGWADLISGTVVARPRRDSAAGDTRV